MILEILGSTRVSTTFSPKMHFVGEDQRVLPFFFGKPTGPPFRHLFGLGLYGHLLQDYYITLCMMLIINAIHEASFKSEGRHAGYPQGLGQKPSPEVWCNRRVSIATTFM